MNRDLMLLAALTGLATLALSLALNLASFGIGLLLPF